MEPTQQNGAGAKHERPSLMNSPGTAAGATKGGPSIRLLDAIALETTARSPARQRRSAVGWLLGGTALAAAAVGWMWLGASPATSGHDPLVGTTVLAAASAPASSPALAPTPQASASQAVTEASTALAVADASSGAARIESMPTTNGTGVTVAALATGSLAERDSTAAEKAMPPAPASDRPDTVHSKIEDRLDLKAETKRADAGKGKASTAPDRSVAARSSTANAKARAAAERGVAAVKAKPSTAAKTPARRSHEVDPDADVVAAIMASLDKRGAAPLAGAQGTAAAPQARSGGNMAELVGRCNSLPDDEMLACRKRACDGQWGKVQVCPSSLAPQVSAHP